MLIIALYLTAVLIPCWGSALVVYFTLCLYFYIQPDETFLGGFKFLPRSGRTSSR